jgi:hypothetical protein
MANAPLPGRDGDRYAADLAYRKRDLFLIPGIDMISENQK